MISQKIKESNILVHELKLIFERSDGVLVDKLLHLFNLIRFSIEPFNVSQYLMLFLRYLINYVL